MKKNEYFKNKILKYEKLMNLYYFIFNYYF